MERTETTEEIPRAREDESVDPRRQSIEITKDHRPWWVRKAVRPKYELDDSVYRCFDPRHHAFGIAARERRRAQGTTAKTLETGSRRELDRPFRLEKAVKGRPGWELRDRALTEGANTVRVGLAKTLYSWHRIQARAPEDFGVGRHDATPSENSRLVKVAARFYGALDVGVAVLDRRHVYSNDEQGRPIVFEDVDAPIVDENRRVIPESCRWAIVFTVAQSEEAFARAPDAISAAGVGMGYSLMAFVAGSLAEFVRALGYTAVASGNDTALSVPLAIDAGLGEMSRMGLLITPSRGPRVRLAKVITDLPLVQDFPIDFGAREFCISCMKCARLCPSRSISFAAEPNYDVLGEWNNPGHRGWYINAYTCHEYWNKVGTGCATCLRVCPYGKRDSMLHRTVLTAISLTPKLNRLFAVADDWFKFGQRRHPDKWWAVFPEPFGLD